MCDISSKTKANHAVALSTKNGALSMSVAGIIVGESVTWAWFGLFKMSLGYLTTQRSHIVLPESPNSTLSLLNTDSCQNIVAEGGHRQRNSFSASWLSLLLDTLIHYL